MKPGGVRARPASTGLEFTPPSPARGWARETGDGFGELSGDTLYSGCLSPDPTASRSSSLLSRSFFCPILLSHVLIPTSLCFYTHLGIPRQPGVQAGTGRSRVPVVPTQGRRPNETRPSDAVRNGPEVASYALGCRSPNIFFRPATQGEAAKVLVRRRRPHGLYTGSTIRWDRLCLISFPAGHPPRVRG